MNAIHDTVKSIFGSRFPVTATSFHTDANMACFLLGKSGKWAYRKMTKQQREAMHKAGLIGTFGWSLQ